ncbi:hypothetical protein PG985_011103 [Apiospora marii]|uniref:Uncharacterized protein n=1 Tax=Apiospora marii TaxID=335849 RepID=A0ABR1SSS6_9PEZI
MVVSARVGNGDAFPFEYLDASYWLTARGFAGALMGNVVAGRLKQYGNLNTTIWPVSPTLSNPESQTLHGQPTRRHGWAASSASAARHIACMLASAPLPSRMGFKQD